MTNKISYGQLVNIWIEHGRTYVTNRGYVHIHFYTTNKTLADYIVNRTNGRCSPHQAIYDVALTSRKSLQLLSQALLRQELAEQHRKLLVLIYRYATAKTVEERRALATRIKLLLKPLESVGTVTSNNVPADTNISSGNGETQPGLFDDITD